MRTALLIIYSLFFNTIVLLAQENKDDQVSLTEGLTVEAEVQASLSDNKTPLWLNANKYGLSSLEGKNGYVRLSALKPLSEDFSRRAFDVAYGIDVAVPREYYCSDFVVQQAFVEARWLNGVLSVGSKQRPMELKNNELSSGSQTFGINARPIPEVRLSLEDWWTLPFGKRWLHFKGHISYGALTDSRWQRKFTNQETKYSENTLYHSKSGYLKIGNEDREFPLSLTLGLESATMFGGTSHYFDEAKQFVTVKNDNGLSAFLHAFIPGGSEKVENKYLNVEGDILGSWVARLDYKAESWNLGVYYDHFFEDHSSLFYLDYDGYGKGEEWDKKKDNRFLRYGFKDMMLGVDWRMSRETWLDQFTFEYIYTKYQSGPIYHDHTTTIPDHIGGQDDYYNHWILSGWQHWGQVLGNPLYRSPIYNTDGRIQVQNNRFVAYHLGIGGHLSENLSYRLLVTWQDAMGTYDTPYDSYQHSLNLLAEASYRVESRKKWADGWHFTAAFGMDRGQVHGDNIGGQLTIGKTIFHSKH